jgi:predicted CoA-binding protein
MILFRCNLAGRLCRRLIGALQVGGSIATSGSNAEPEPMPVDDLDDATVRNILARVRRIALVGASARPERAAHGIQLFLQQRGVDVTPVNPGLAGTQIHGRTVVASLDDAVPIEMSDVFRTADAVPAIVDDAIRLGAKVLWLQLGLIHHAAAAKARAAGITVVMDRCPAIEARRLAA